jgi:hypothetical protein
MTTTSHTFRTESPTGQRLFRVGAVVAVLTAALFVGVGRANSADPNVGDDSRETQYVPITPCRTVDTRLGGGGKMTSGNTRVWLMTGAGSLANQGGNANGCGVPSVARAVSLNVTVTETVGAAYLTLYPVGATLPLASTINWFASGQTLANGATIALGKGLGTGRLNVFDGGGSTHAVIDVTGYYLEQIRAIVKTDGSLKSHTNRVDSSTRASTGVYELTLADNFDADECVVSATSEGGARHVAGSTTNNHVTVIVTDDDGDFVDAPVDVLVSC